MQKLKKQTSCIDRINRLIKLELTKSLAKSKIRESKSKANRLTHKSSEANTSTLTHRQIGTRDPAKNHIQRLVTAKISLHIPRLASTLNRHQHQLQPLSIISPLQNQKFRKKRISVYPQVKCRNRCIQRPRHTRKVTSIRCAAAKYIQSSRFSRRPTRLNKSNLRKSPIAIKTSIMVASIW